MNIFVNNRGLYVFFFNLITPMEALFGVGLFYTDVILYLKYDAINGSRQIHV